MIWEQRVKLAERIRDDSPITPEPPGQFQIILDTLLTLEEYGLLGDDIP